MNPSIRGKLDKLMDRHEELERLLSDAGVIADQERFRTYSREYAELEPVVLCYRQVQSTRQDLDEARSLADENDPELRELAEQ
ncbi:MAG TPA: PCRF domain-containing protein, partial [Pseudomonadaceae bacterium]|nr:PCRF domain-containing protein [Pseudomonadaceae bacterium]